MTETDSAAVEYFSRRLAFETDPSDVAEALAAGEPLQLVDVRSLAAWEQGHAPQAVHLPRRELSARALAELDPSRLVVVYCWSPACNGGVRAALELARLGFPVKEMLGGFEYWAREGLPVVTAEGDGTRAVDALVGPVPDAGAAVVCAC